jgi:hypothetical protein
MPLKMEDAAPLAWAEPNGKPVRCKKVAHGLLNTEAAAVVIDDHKAALGRLGHTWSSIFSHHARNALPD